MPATSIPTAATATLLARRCSEQEWHAAWSAVATVATVATAAAGSAQTAVLLGGPGTGLSSTVLGLPLLQASACAVDGWWVERAAAERRGQCGAVQWRQAGGWLHGVIDLLDGAKDLQSLARAAYQDIFATLRTTGTGHLLRVWNYLPRINDASSGLERYRQFNAGRQQAFIDAGQDAFEGSPAACALGTAGSSLCLRFLAGPVAAVPVENPRQTSAYRYPAEHGPRSPTFSRGALCALGPGRVALFVSGTASIVGHASLHHGDVRSQTQETLRNLQAVLAAAGVRSGLHFDLAAMSSTVYLRYPADQAAVMQVLTDALGPQAHACASAIVVQADICRSELLVEIEGHLVVDGSLPPG